MRISVIVFQIALPRDIRDFRFSLRNQNDDAGTTLVTTPLSEVHFVVTMVASYLEGLLLEVSTGGSNVRYQYRIVQENTSLTLESVESFDGDDEIRVKLLSRSDCVLSIELSHIYSQEGMYSPVVNVSNAYTQVMSRSLRNGIIVETRLSEAHINIPEVVAVNQTVNCTVNLAASSANKTCTWFISEVNAPLLPLSQPLLPKMQTIPWVFPQQGTYHIKVVVANRHGRVEASSQVTVEIPVSGLNLASNLQTPYVRLRQVISFFAFIEQGSNVDFEWDFDDTHVNETPIAYRDDSSVANHTFTEPGEYNVTIHAYNLYNRVSRGLGQLIVVQEPVSTLVVRVVGVALLDESTTFVAMVTSGSHVQFTFDFSDGSEKQQISNVTNVRWVTLSRTFTNAGLYTVTVSAYNTISAIHEEVEVLVQRRIPSISLVAYPRQPVVNENTVFTVETDGEPF